MLKRLWSDECGAVLSAELILLLVVLIIGLGVGLVALRDSVNAELVDVGSAIVSLDPAYFFAGVLYTPDAQLLAGAPSIVDGSCYASPIADITALAPGTVLADGGVVADLAVVKGH